MATAEFARLKGKLDELLQGSGVTEDRLVTEAALITARADVEEELVRLRTHIDRFVEILDGGGEVGRQLDFLLQEMNREVNTIGSKADGLGIAELIISTKAELEKMREQVQNVE
jgi:uncharacterized protein (TIGR00255 family)